MPRLEDERLDLFSLADRRAEPDSLRAKSTKARKPNFVKSTPASDTQARPKPSDPVSTHPEDLDHGSFCKFLSVSQVAERYSVACSTIWRWAKDLDGFPKPIQVASGTTRWPLAELMAFDQGLQKNPPACTKQNGARS